MTSASTSPIVADLGDRLAVDQHVRERRIGRGHDGPAADHLHRLSLLRRLPRALSARWPEIARRASRSPDSGVRRCAAVRRHVAATTVATARTAIGADQRAARSRRRLRSTSTCRSALASRSSSRIVWRRRLELRVVRRTGIATSMRCGTRRARASASARAVPPPAQQSAQRALREALHRERELADQGALQQVAGHVDVELVADQLRPGPRGTRRPSARPGRAARAGGPPPASARTAPRAARRRRPAARRPAPPGGRSRCPPCAPRARRRARASARSSSSKASRTSASLDAK